MNNKIKLIYLSITVVFMLLFSFLFLGNVNAYGETCYGQYGFGAQDNFDGTCSCSSGYHFGKNTFGDTQCIKNPTCSDTYGFMAITNFDDTCSCLSGYEFGIDIFGKKSCVKSKTCSDIYGYGAKETIGGKCSCRYNYTWGTRLGKDYCVDGENFCTDSYGYNSSFNDDIKSCECDAGYTLKDGKCEEKHNSAYFFLSEYNDDNNEAVVISFYTQKKYLLELRYTSGLYRAENFIGKRIVINLGTDFNIDRYDKFILNDDLIAPYDVVTDILDVDEVDADFTLKTCEDIFGDNAEETYDNKCKCGIGYKWNYNKTSCEEEVLNSYKKSPKYCPDTINGYRGIDNICYCNTGYSFSSSQNKCLMNTPMAPSIDISTSSINNISCGIHSSSKKTGECSCDTGYEWVDVNNNNNFDCTLMSAEEENYETTMNIDERIKNRIDGIIIKLRIKFLSYNDEKKLKIYNDLSSKISIILNKKNISKTDKNILKYLQLLIKEEVRSINNEDLINELLGE